MARETYEIPQVSENYLEEEWRGIAMKFLEHLNTDFEMTGFELIRIMELHFFNGAGQYMTMLAKAQKGEISAGAMTETPHIIMDRIEKLAPKNTGEK